MRRSSISTERFHLATSRPRLASGRSHLDTRRSHLATARSHLITGRTHLDTGRSQLDTADPISAREGPILVERVPDKNQPCPGHVRLRLTHVPPTSRPLDLSCSPPAHFPLKSRSSRPSPDLPAHVLDTSRSRHDQPHTARRGAHAVGGTAPKGRCLHRARRGGRSGRLGGGGGTPRTRGAAAQDVRRRRRSLLTSTILRADAEHVVVAHKPNVVHGAQCTFIHTQVERERLGVGPEGIDRASDRGFELGKCGG
eukprot:CAMPEP_0183336074 /NCGR_PEP_ID=MMETSP0164_2-20130417/4170_1 /TAXON_ID=221442 /ORGANISM="Coccolithus pelagicus ssp braarudi, Strain PLY182g" /LENGTH=253 /DNA_ID=CAMNT_0025505537 /DNA_START=20 /DNA_END=781 /DNA_ORIENTATION=-